jgi:flagellar basal body P-ring protein FlgI
MNRRRIVLGWALVLVILGGCSTWNPLATRSQSPEEKAKERQKRRDTRGQLVGDVASPMGMFPVNIEAVGWVTGLHATGSDPEPSPQRAVLIEEMQRRGVENPNALLASHNASLVLVRGVLRPGIQKGDHFDVEVRVPGRSETTSLRGGYLLETRLTETRVMNDGMIHNGHEMGAAQGPILVDPTATANSETDRPLLKRGRILGGGTCYIPRALGLVLKPEHSDAVVSARVAAAVNKRFHSFQKGIEIGVATAHTDKYIELAVHPQYKENLDRYMQVIRAVAIQETSTERMKRIADLEGRLLRPETAARAAVELEAIGGAQGTDVLLKGLKASDVEVQFYAAEALAYLGHREAAEPLGRIARQERAFRMLALTALAVLDDPAASQQLSDLLNAPSAETRYGAFRALWTMNPDEPLVKGEQLGGQFHYHVLETPGVPMIHVTRSQRAEVVLFGRSQRFSTPLSVSAGNQIMITSTEAGEIAVSKFSVRDADQRRVVSTKVDEVIRAIVELGGTYPDVVQALQEAKAAGALPSRFEVEALPEGGRPYQRVAQATEAANDEAAKKPPPPPGSLLE